MKYLFFFFTILALVCKGGVVFSLEPGPPIERRDEIFAVHFQDEKTGWIVGNKGLMLKTLNGGKNWVRKEKTTEDALYAVSFVDNEGWVVGQKGTILHSNDGGERWESQESKCESSLMGVCFLDKQKGVAIGEGGIILNTEDGGRSWQQNPLDMMSILPESLVERGIMALNFYAVFFLDESHGWIVGDSGVVLFSSDGGRKWEVLGIGLFPNLFSVFFRDDLNGWAAGQNGLLLHTADGGKVWEKLETGTEENLYSICMKEDFGIVVGDNGTVFQSKDGKRWDKVGIELGVPPPCIIDASILGSVSSTKSIIFVGENVIKSLYLN